MPTLVRRQIDTPIGTLVAGAVEPGESPLEPGGVCLLELGSVERRARETIELEDLLGGRFADHVKSELLDALESQLGDYFSGNRRDFDLPLVTPGTRFQHDVWNAMRRIPFGLTVTYGELARSIGKEPTAARAVGAASGRNRVSIIIPCHRVVDLAYDPAVGGSAGLRGYGGGLENKRLLLEHERRIAGGPGLFEAALDGPIRGSRSRS